MQPHPTAPVIREYARPAPMPNKRPYPNLPAIRNDNAGVRNLSDQNRVTSSLPPEWKARLATAARTSRPDGQVGDLVIRGAPFRPRQYRQMRGRLPAEPVLRRRYNLRNNVQSLPECWQGLRRGHRPGLHTRVSRHAHHVATVLFPLQDHGKPHRFS